MKEFTGFLRGINVGGWLTNYKRMGKLRPQWRHDLTPGDRKHFASYFSERDVTNIKDAFGVDHIRLCFDQVVIEDYQTGAYIEQHLRYIDDCLLWCERAGLRVILNLHHGFGAYCDIPDDTLFDEGNGQLRARFVRLWEMLDERYRDKPGVVFELLNEPALEVADSKKWNALAAETVAAIRKRGNTRVIMVGGVCWNLPCSLNDMLVCGDKRVVYTFHFYAPHIFTHQRTFTSELHHYYNCALSYPSDDTSAYDAYLKFIDPDRGDFDLFPRIDKAYLRAEMQPVLAWMAAHPDEILYLGEFGTISCADMASRENWTRDVLSLCDEYGIPFCIWNYLSTPYDGNRFSLVDDYTRRPVSAKMAAMIRGK
ncbi:MAG: glycoside hydrolase family 5 protein [Clostridiales bacterium]|jgi:hypothetical protein|nr:glycoside hydrolase family 5 protein [Clostridiales bacterium]